MHPAKELAFYPLNYSLFKYYCIINNYTIVSTPENIDSFDQPGRGLEPLHITYLLQLSVT